MPHFEVGHKQLIHVLERSQEDLAMHFAKVKEHQFDSISHQTTGNGLEQINGCVTYYECETVSVHVGGDHNIIVAKVLGLKNNPALEPLIFARSKFMGLEVAEIKTV